MWRGSGSAGSPRSMWSGTRSCRRSSRPMNDTKEGSRSNRPPDPAPGTGRDRSLKEGARGLRMLRLAARDFLFLCSLALALFFLAKAVMDVLPAGFSAWGGTIPSHIYVYLIPLPAFAIVVRVLLNSEVG